MPSTLQNIIRGQFLKRNAVYSLAGQGLPIIVAVVTIPLLIQGLGTERFGVLTLVWIVIGYFSLFDFGVGRALTKLTAEKLGHDRENEIPTLFYTALSLMGGLGMIAAVGLLCFDNWLVRRILSIPLVLQEETIRALSVMAIGIPIVIISIGLRGVLEAYQRFRLISIVRFSLGLLTYLGPIAVLNFSNNLVPIVSIIVFGRFCALLVYFYFNLRTIPFKQLRPEINISQIRPLLSFGSWLTVSNIISPLMIYMDRIFIGIFLSMTAVTYYVTPFEVVNKLLFIPSAISAVFFPLLSTVLVNNPDNAIRIYRRGICYVAVLIFPITLILILYGDYILQLWLGKEFVINSSMVLRIMAIGLFLNSIAFLPSAFIQANGRPDITAKLHLVELPLYLFLLFVFLKLWGINGAAFAWTIRVSVDLFFLLLITQKTIQQKYWKK
jgi:O-antigen/teichoic acid export membrane protein